MCCFCRFIKLFFLKKMKCKTMGEVEKTLHKIIRLFKLYDINYCRFYSFSMRTFPTKSRNILLQKYK